MYKSVDLSKWSVEQWCALEWGQLCLDSLIKCKWLKYLTHASGWSILMPGPLIKVHGMWALPSVTIQKHTYCCADIFLHDTSLPLNLHFKWKGLIAVNTVCTLKHCLYHINQTDSRKAEALKTPFSSSYSFTKWGVHHFKNVTPTLSKWLLAKLKNFPPKKKS